ncbi:MAG: IS66 family transposase [bacterium]|nr:IS66 family transposase [bacterium]
MIENESITSSTSFSCSQVFKQLGPLLSQESYETIKKELKHLEKAPPRFKGSGAYHPQYDPVTREELRVQNRMFKDRLDWLRKSYMLCELQNEFLSKANGQLKKENEKLKQENEELHREKERMKLQLQKLLRVNKKRVKKGNAEDAEGKNSDQKKRSKRGAPKGHVGRTRSIPEKIDEVEIIPPPEVCPNCGKSNITPSTEFIAKYVEDIPPVVKKVVQKKYMWGCCNDCHTSTIAPEAEKGPPVRVGPNLITLLTILRQQMAAPYRKLAQFSTEGLQIALSPSGALGILNRVSKKFEPIYKGIEASLPFQPVLHGDETGWKMDGINWYLWCFCNRFLIYFHPNVSRGSKVPKAILGTDYPGIIHADFYAAYNFISKIQRCLVHLQGDINDEIKISPDDIALKKLKEGIKEIIRKGLKVKQLSLPTLLTDSASKAKTPRNSTEKEKRKGRREVQKILDRLTQLESENKKTMTLIGRIIKHEDSLLRFIDHPDVEYHNNRAERAIRPMVIARKISFGNRSPQGAYYNAVLTSVIETYRLKDKNLRDFVQSVYNAPEEKLKDITRALLDTS